MKINHFWPIKLFGTAIVSLTLSLWGLNSVEAQIYPDPWLDTVTSEYWCTWNVTGVVCDNIIPKCIGGSKCWAGSVYSCYGCNCSSCPKYSTGASGCHGYLYQSTCGGTYCANSGVPAPYLQYIPTYNCHYISSVNSWTSCVGGVQWAASVTWSTVAGTSCSNVALSQSCVPPVPVVDIKANGSDNPIPIDYNTAAVISWTSTNADSCLVTPSGWTEINNPGVSSGNLTATTTYTLTCTNSYGTSTPDSVTVNVNQPACACAASIDSCSPPNPLCIFGDPSPNPPTISGSSFIWTCSNPAVCTGSPGCSSVRVNPDIPIGSDPVCSTGSCSADCGGGTWTKTCQYRDCHSTTENFSCNSQPCLNEGYREVTPW